MARSGFDMSSTEEAAAQNFGLAPVTARSELNRNLQRLAKTRPCKHTPKSPNCNGTVDVKTLKHDRNTESCSTCIIEDTAYECRDCGELIPEARKKAAPGGFCIGCQTELEEKQKRRFRN